MGKYSLLYQTEQVPEKQKQQQETIDVLGSHRTQLHLLCTGQGEYALFTPEFCKKVVLLNSPEEISLQRKM